MVTTLGRLGREWERMKETKCKAQTLVNLEKRLVQTRVTTRGLLSLVLPRASL